jgi:hypothetical protein
LPSCFDDAAGEQASGLDERYLLRKAPARGDCLSENDAPLAVFNKQLGKSGSGRQARMLALRFLRDQFGHLDFRNAARAVVNFRAGGCLSYPPGDCARR